jgi:alkylation response protein AidB-like acyl-CoA dehydrogenase
MNFDFSEEQKLLQKTARDYLEDNAPLSVCRAVLESKETHSEELWKGAAEMGWLGAAVPEEYGGAGFGHLELALIAGEVGRALAPIPFASSVYLATEALLVAGTAAQKKEHLTRLVAGETIGCLAIAERAGQIGENSVQVSYAKGKLNGTKVPVLDGDIAGLGVVAARSAEGVTLVLANLDDASVTRESVRSIDPARSQGKITFKNTPAEVLGTAGEGWALTEQILDRAAVLLAFEQLGAAERAFEITKDYAMGRYAFGRPIASFQAIKHRLADLYVALELARSNAYYGAWALENDSPELATAACGARVSATEALDLAGTEMIQIHGGVGYTWEYDCHMFYRRSKLLGLAIGSASEWREKLIQRLEAAA